MVKAIIPTLLAVAAAAGCARDDLDDPGQLPEADLHYFRCNVQPVIAARCGFLECHGNTRRPFLVYAEQRLRVDVPPTEFDTPLTDDELQRNFRITRGFFARDLLWDKPLDTRAGGQFHRGQDLYGTEDVFLTRDDPGYAILRDFAAGVTAPADCVPREDIEL